MQGIRPSIVYNIPAKSLIPRIRYGLLRVIMSVQAPGIAIPENNQSYNSLALPDRLHHLFHLVLRSGHLPMTTKMYISKPLKKRHH